MYTHEHIMYIYIYIYIYIKSERPMCAHTMCTYMHSSFPVHIAYCALERMFNLIDCSKYEFSYNLSGQAPPDTSVAPIVKEVCIYLLKEF